MRRLFGYVKKLNVIQMQVRYKNPEHHWSQLLKLKFPKDKALEHFDDFYKSVYQGNWENIRSALLSKRHKYLAVVNNFSCSEDTENRLEELGALNMKIMYNLKKERLAESENENYNVKLQPQLQIDRVVERIQMNELESIYPEGSNIFVEKINTNEDDKLRNKSENEEDDEGLFDVNEENKMKPVQMKSIEYGNDIAIASDRIIDQSDGLSNSSLFEYIPPTKIKGLDDWASESDHYNFYKLGDDFRITVMAETDLKFPEHLSLYAFEQESRGKFPNPRKGAAEVSEYFLFDGASILPVLALNLKPGDTVLDMCSAPGGKALAILQTLMPKVLVANDISNSRISRIKKIFKEYIADIGNWDERLFVTKSDARFIQDKDIYNRILVDVPCTTDRHSLHEDDENYFHADRIKERLRLPELQAEILTNALKIVMSGGTVVYSTCSLSPIQNEGVIKAAMKNAWEQTKCEFVVKDMSEALRPLEYFYEFQHCPYGHLVIPTKQNNWGPLYFCKIQKVR